MNKLTCYLYAEYAPTSEQEKGILAFLNGKYGKVCLEFVEDKSLKGGFKLVCGNDTYDTSILARISDYKNQIKNSINKKGDVISLIKKASDSYRFEIKGEKTGYVASAGDCVATVCGLEGAEYGEILLFENGVKGIVQEMNEKEIKCILFDDDGVVFENSKVIRTGKTAGVPVGENFLGRVINALGAPIDKKGDITESDYYPIESPAPGIIDRQKVNEPIYTGLLSIDSMFPIGKGQRELIIGDRQTGKTAIAIDTILNQKGKNIICIYVAIGQKSSSVAKLYRDLADKGAMDYTIIINATAADGAAMQYVAPYAGCSMGEYFMNKGQDVLIVYDDLSKHAIAYRSLSLLLDRSPGREAYPGDVFYLHSRLLERAAHLSDEKGGGSMTALPIVETQAGDVSAYIPTNIISITDGQIFLEEELFFAGQRPAVNVGLSVSRVGGDAQTKAMKKATGTLRLDLAQYREMKVFTQFASDLDDETRKTLEYGKSLMAMLCQPRFSPLSHHSEVIILVLALNRILTEIPESKITDFTAKVISHFENEHDSLIKRIDDSKILTDGDIDEINKIGNAFMTEYKK